MRKLSTRVCAVFAMVASLGGACRAQSPQAGQGQISWWRPAQTDTFNIQLQGAVKPDVGAKVYDIDLFDTPQTTINVLKSQGRRVVCYFSAGSSENFRADFSKFQPTDMGNPLKGWEGERWLDVRSANVREIMLSRLDLAVSKGCDGVDPDNVDGFDPANDSGFDFTDDDQLAFNEFLAVQAHRRNLAVGLKNDVAQLDDLLPFFDFAVNEQCHIYKECVAYRRFTARRRAVFNIEYASKYKAAGPDRDGLCKIAQRQRIRTLVLPLKLDGSSRFSCD